MFKCCTCCAPSPEESTPSGTEGVSPSSRPLLRMRWGKPRPVHVHSEIVASESFEAGLSIHCNGAQYTLCDVIGTGAHCTVWRCLRVSSAPR